MNQTRNQAACGAAMEIIRQGRYARSTRLRNSNKPPRRPIIPPTLNRHPDTFECPSRMKGHNMPKPYDPDAGKKAAANLEAAVAEYIEAVAVDRDELLKIAKLAKQLQKQAGPWREDYANDELPARIWDELEKLLEKY